MTDDTLKSPKVIFIRFSDRVKNSDFEPKRGWDKSPSLSIIFGLSSKMQWLSGLYYTDFISFTALLNCAEVGRRNRILTNYRFLSHSLFGQSRPCNYCLPDCSIFQKSVTAPRDAEETIWAYLPRTPRLYSGGKVVSALRFANSSSETCMVISLVSWSTVTKSLYGGRRLDRRPELQARYVQQRDRKSHLRNDRLSRGPPCPLGLSQRS